VIDTFTHLNSINDRKMAVSIWSFLSSLLFLDYISYSSSMSSRSFRITQTVPSRTKWPSFRMYSSNSVRRLLLHALLTLPDNAHPDPVYDDLSHPPATYIGPDFAYRRIDGACNNPGDPDLGKAGRPYARSVQQLHPLPRNMLPSADLVFEALLKRRKVWSCPCGLICMLTCVPVRQAPCRTFQYDVFICGACHPHVSPPDSVIEMTWL
jgi:hypothetical protein